MILKLVNYYVNIFQTINYPILLKDTFFKSYPRIIELSSEI